MKPIHLVALLAASLCACAVNMPYSAIGGSRSDGTVKLGIEYAPLVVPRPDETQGANLAAQRCATWGYSGAEAFGGTLTSCARPSMGGCNAYLLIKEYQCTGDGAGLKPAQAAAP